MSAMANYQVTAQAQAVDASSYAHVHAHAPTRTLLHRDGYGRLQDMKHETWGDYYLRPKDGRLDRLRVQKSQFLSSPSPWIIQVIRFMYSGTIESDPWGDNNASASNHVKAAAKLAIRWVPGSVAIMILLFFPVNLVGEVRNFGNYDPIRYREWLCAKIPRNAYEGKSAAASTTQQEQRQHKETRPLMLDEEQTIDMPTWSSQQTISWTIASGPVPKSSSEVGIMKRDLGPKYLCFFLEGEDRTMTYRTMNVRDYIEKSPSKVEPEYVFISYTRKQFCVATDEEVDHWNVTEEARSRYKAQSSVDRAALGAYGIRAAQKADVSAFWVDFECLRPDVEAGETAHSMSDVYRICDIVRNSSTLVVVRGPPIDDKLAEPTASNKAAWLRQWGERLWTVPEGLLCPSDTIDIYTHGEPGGGGRPEPTWKRRLAVRAWADADNMSQLLDHYESSIHLTPLELGSIALEGLQWRKTDMVTPGDASYALMGLLRRRPEVDKTDSDFEAFARLSLANDSDLLLERLLCMQPSAPDAPWHEVRDAWGARLWDIDPNCQVAGIVDNRTVTLDGAYGATIHWHDLKQVAFFKRNTIWRAISIAIIRAFPLYLLIGVVMLIMGGYIPGSETNTLTSIGWAIVASTALLELTVPVWLYRLYRGKFWSTQAWFFGMAGIPDLGHVEQCLFGLNCGRLQWSAAGSLLSRHEVRHGERRSLPPLELQRAAVPTAPDGKPLKVYTVVDTFTLTATAFYAERPPSVVMICGREGGMQRAVLCSYDWRTQTFCRETVLRMKTLVLERMSRVDRFRFCLSRYGREVQEV